MAGVKRRIYTESDTHALHKELDEVSCPICMDHPHNAVLLLCSSHDKGCRSYICDTSYRHSNCLDRFKKLRTESRNGPPLESSLPINANNSRNTSELNLALGANATEGSDYHNTVTAIEALEGPGESSLHHLNRNLDSEGEGILEIRNSEPPQENLSESRMRLTCPLCRGTVLGWKVVEEARMYLNMKKRSCSRESCSFVGNYQELRRHARRVHPTTRPSDVDPSRERAWRRLEHQREYGDIVSAIRSAMPGAVVVGDYVIENGDRVSGQRENGDISAPWWTTFFLFQMIGSLDRGGGGGSGGGSGSRAHRSRAWTRHRRLSERRYLWGENLLGLQDYDDNDDDDDDLRMVGDADDDFSPVPRRRRRLTRSRSEEDHP